MPSYPQGVAYCAPSGLRKSPEGRNGIGRGNAPHSIARAVSWLTDDGLFAAHLDLANLRGPDGRPLARRAAALFRSAGLSYDRHRRLLTCRGRRGLTFPLVYLGADDAAGPNWTGQEAVNSHYRPAG